MLPKRLRRILFCSLVFSSCLFIHPGILSGQYIRVKVPLELRDNQSRRVNLTFGVDSSATDCIDADLGEFELPSDQCSGAPFCAYFTTPPFYPTNCLGNGLLLDLRAYVSPIQVNLYLIDFSTSDYPVTFYWPKNLNANYDSLKIHDAINGSLFSVNMLTAESLVVSNTSVQQVMITAGGPRGFLDAVNDDPAFPLTTMLYQNYPNPFNPTTQIRYILAQRVHVVLKVYNLLGQPVGTLVDAIQPAGEHRVTWQPTRAQSGIYYYRLATPDHILTKSMLYIK